MNLFEIHITPRQLLAWPENERRFFIFLGHMTNELNIEVRILLWNHNSILNITDDESVDEYERKILLNGLISQFFSHSSSFCAKLYETWQAFQKIYYRSRLSREYSAMLRPETLESLAKIGRQMEGDKLIPTIRNKAGFHYDSLIFSIEPTDEHNEDDFVFYLSNSNINTLSNISNVIVSHNILKLSGIKKKEKSLDHIMDTLQEIHSEINEVLATMQALCIKRNQPDILDALENIQKSVNCKHQFREFSLPHFVETDD